MNFSTKYLSWIKPFIPSSIFLRIQYYRLYGRELNVISPTTYAEKIAWIKLHPKQFNYSYLADKHLVRSYVQEKAGEDILVPMYGVFSGFDEIDFDVLPDQFVMKCTHDSGSTTICKNKKDLDITGLKVFYEAKLKKNLYDYSRENSYKNLVPKIIVEQFISDDGEIPMDFKFMCFNGKVEVIVVDKDRFSNHKRNFYDRDWHRMDITSDHPQFEEEIEKPNRLEEMIRLSEVLSEGFVHVRIDLYCLAGKIYFGEMTFTPWGGVIWFTPDSSNYSLGQLIDLSSYMA